MKIRYSILAALSVFRSPVTVNGLNTWQKNLVVSLTFFVPMLSAQYSNAQTTYDWAGTGTATSWATPGNWKVGGVTQTTNYPGLAAGDIVRIGSGFAFTGTGVPTISSTLPNDIASVTFGTSGVASGTTISVATGVILTITGDITYQNTTAAAFTSGLTGAGTGSISAANLKAINSSVTGNAYTNTVNISVPTLTLSGDLLTTTTQSSATKFYNMTVNITSGKTTINAYGTTNTANATSTLTISSGATLEVLDPTPFSGLSGTGTNTLTTGGTGANFEYGGASQTIYTSASYRNLILSGSGTKSVGASLAIAGTLSNASGVTLSVTSGIFSVAGTTTNSGTITNTSSSTFSLNGAVTNNASSTITHSGSALMKFALTTNNSGLIENQTTVSGGTMTFTGILTNNAAGTVTQNGTSTLATMTFTATPVNSGTIQQTNAAAVAFPSAFTNNSGGTIEQASGVTGAIMTVTGATTNSGTITQNNTVGGSMTYSSTLGNSSVINLTSTNTGSITVTGAFTNNAAGTLTVDAGTLTFSNTFTNSGTVNQSGGTMAFNNASNAAFKNNASPATFTATGGTVNFGTGTQNQTLTNLNTTTAVTLFNVTFSTGGTKSVLGTGDYVFNGTVATSGSVVNISTADVTNNGTFNAGSAAVTFGLTFTNGSSADYNSGTALTTFTGVVTNNSGGAINLINTGGITFSSPLTNAGDVVKTGSGTITLNGATVNSGNITQGSTTLFSFPTTLTNTGTITQTNSGQVTVVSTTANNSGGLIKQASTVTGAVMLFTQGVTNSAGGTITQDNTVGGTMTFSSTLANSGLVQQTATNTGTITFTGVITNGASTSELTFRAGTATVTAAFTNSASANLNQFGPGTVTFSSTFANSGTVTQSGGTLTFPLISASVFTNNASPATFTASAGTVTFSAAGAQTLTNNNTTTPVTFYNATLSGTAGAKTLSGTGSFNIASQGLLTITSPATLATGGLLTLKSDAGGSASVSQLTGTPISGNVNVERFVSGGQSYSRGYRLLSSPVSVSSVNMVLPNLTYIKATAYVTGTTSTGGGFDNATTANPTLYFYREGVPVNTSSFITGNFRGVNKIAGNPNPYDFSLDNETGTFTMPAGNGFLFFFRGDRTTNLTPTVTSSIATPATFTATGYLNQGPITVKPWKTGASTLMYNAVTGNSPVVGYNLVGNPYASSIDWDLVTANVGTTNITGAIYIYNPTKKCYATYQSGGGGNGTNFNGPGGTADIIPSGQGFFVRATSTPSQALAFAESNKVTTQVGASTISLASANNPADIHFLRLQVFKDSLNNEDALVFFKDSAKTKFVNTEDAEYLKGNSIVNISTRSSDNVSLAINNTSLSQLKQTIPVNVNVAVAGTYRLNLSEIKNIPASFDVWLLDSYLKDSLDFKANPTYSFNASLADTASFGANRFKLIIKQNGALAMHLLSFDATKNPTNVGLNWIVENEGNYTTFVLQRSINGGSTYTTLDSLKSGGYGSYTSLDPNAVIGNNWYRLKITDITGAVTYSAIVPVNFTATTGTGDKESNITVSPNPVQDKLTIHIKPKKQDKENDKANSFNITITNSNGIVVKTGTTNSRNWEQDAVDMLPGTYFVNVTSTNEGSFVGRTTFVKL